MAPLFDNLWLNETPRGSLFTCKSYCDVRALHVMANMKTIIPGVTDCLWANNRLYAGVAFFMRRGGLYFGPIQKFNG